MELGFALAGPSNEKAWPSMSGLGARGPGFVKLHAETRDTRPETRFSDHHAVTMRFQRTRLRFVVIREQLPRMIAGLSLGYDLIDPVQGNALVDVIREQDAAGSTPPINADNYT